MLCSGSVGHGQPKRAARRMPGLGHRAHPQLGAARQRREIALDREVLAGVIERLAGPQALQDLDRLLEARHLRLRVEPEEVELRGEVAQADAELEPAVGEHVDHRRVLGDVHRVLEREQVHRGADVDALGERRERAQRCPRRGQIGVGHHVVLGHEQAVPARCLRRLAGGEDLLPALADVRRLGRILRPEQQSELHCTVSSSLARGKVSNKRPVGRCAWRFAEMWESLPHGHRRADRPL